MQDVLLEKRPKISPDGQWWWNGQQWRPISEYHPQDEKQRMDPLDRRLLVVGYIFAVLPFFAFPGLLVQAGVGLGITNIIKGQTWHGIAMIAITVATAVAGSLLGGKGMFG